LMKALDKYLVPEDSTHGTLLQGWEPWPPR
jgi:hypothetical protein